MNKAQMIQRASEARKRVLLRLIQSDATHDQVVRVLKGLGNYGRPAGCGRLLDDLCARGVVTRSRHRLTTTGPMETVYRLKATACRGCGCDDDNACLDDAGQPCSWAEPGLCTACEAKGIEAP